MVKLGVLFCWPAILSVVLFLWYQLRVFETRVVLIFDSAHYFQTATQLTAIFKAIGSGSWNNALLQAKAPEFAAAMMLDGPVLPLLGAMTLLSTGQPSLSTAWPMLTILLAAFNAISTGTIALLTQRLTGSFRAASLAAVCFACYPCVITSFGRFLTEPIATCLLLLLCYFCSGLLLKSSTRPSLYSACIGLFAAIGLLVKPALLPLLAISIALAYYLLWRSSRPILKQLFVCAAAILLTLSFWLAFTHFVVGQLSLLPQRKPAMNIAVGHHLATDGRGTVGLPIVDADSDIRRLAVEDDKLDQLNDSGQILAQAWSTNPAAVFNLYLRKIPRVMGFVWNDFKQVVLGLNIDAQNFVHAIVLSLSMVGVLYMLVALSVPVPGLVERKYLEIVIPVVIVITSLLYLPFESIVRYGATAQPFIIISAAFALFQIAQLPRKKAIVIFSLILSAVSLLKLDLVASFEGFGFFRALALATFCRAAVVCSAFVYVLLTVGAKSDQERKSLLSKLMTLYLPTLLFIALVVGPLVAVGLFKDSQRECRIGLPAAGRLTREVAIVSSGDAVSGKRFFVYIDCDQRVKQASFYFNDTPILQPLVSVNKLDSSRYWLFNIMRMYASIFDLQVDDLRQWRVLEIPPQLIRFDSPNRLTVAAGASGLTVFADRFDVSEHEINLLGRGFLCSSRLCNDGSELETRIPELTVPLRSGSRALKGDTVEGLGSQAQLPGQARIYVMATAAPKSATIICQPYEGAVALSLFDPIFTSAVGEKALSVNRYTMQMARRMSADVEVPRRFNQESAIEVTLKGQVRSVGRAKKMGLFVSLHGSSPTSPFMILPNSPPFIETSNHWKEFVVNDRIILSDFLTDRLLIGVTVFPGRWEQYSQYGVDKNVGSFLVRDMTLSIKPLNDVDLAKQTTSLY